MLEATICEPYECHSTGKHQEYEYLGVDVECLEVHVYIDEVAQDEDAHSGEQRLHHEKGGHCLEERIARPEDGAKDIAGEGEERTGEQECVSPDFGFIAPAEQLPGVIEGCPEVVGETCDEDSRTLEGVKTDDAEDQ